MRSGRRRCGVTAAALVALVAACSAHTAPAAAPPTSLPRAPTLTTLAPTTIVTATAAPTTTRPVTTTTSGPVAALAPPMGPSSAQALFAQLVPTEEAIRSSATTTDDAAFLGNVEQRDAGILAVHPTWLAAMPAGTPSTIRQAIDDIVAADNALAGIPGPPAPATVPKWRIVAPAPAASLVADYQHAQTQTGTPWAVLAAINLVETRMGRIVGPSTAGAQGPMQFLPGTWAAYGDGGDIHDPAASILAAGRYLHANGAPSKLSAAVFAYNHSTAYVTAILDYAAVMAADPRAYEGFYGWQVYITTSHGELLLPVGYDNA